MLKEKSLIKRIEKAFREAWDHPALTNYGTTLHYDYKDVAERVAYLHLLLDEMGVKPGEKVALCDKNSANWVVTQLALITYRAVSVPLLPDFSETQIANLCEHSESKVLIAGQKLQHVFDGKGIDIKVLDIDKILTLDEKQLNDGAEKQALARLKALYPNSMKPEDVKYEAEDPEALMLISYTSGSTGNPKGVMLPYRSLWSNNTFAIEKLPIPDYSRYFFILPMAHMFGYSFDFLFCVGKKSHAYILTKAPVPKVLLEAFQTAKPHIFLCVPLVMEKIINGKVRPALEKPLMKFLLKVPGLRQVICNKVRTQLIQALGGELYEVVMGGAGLNRDVENILRMVKFPYTVGYGMTELGPLASYADYHETRLGSCGKKVDRIEMTVDSEDPTKDTGEIIIKGMNMMLGYYKNPEATAETIDKDGWLHTGDLGIIDHDGYMFIRGRKKNMLLSSNGQNIYPEEMEEQVVSHSIFDECVVVQRDTKLIALTYVSDITLTAAGKNREDLDLEAIRKEINTYLPKYSQLAAIEQRSEEFEKTPKKSIRRFLYS